MPTDRVELACTNPQCIRNDSTIVIIRTDRKLAGVNFSCGRCGNTLTAIYQVELAEDTDA